MLMPSMREYRLPFAIGPRAQVVTSTVLGAPETFVERGVGRAFGRTGAFPDASVVSVVLAQAAALVRTIYVVREVFAVPGRLAIRLAGLRGQHAIGKARRAAAATLSHGLFPTPLFESMKNQMSCTSAARCMAKPNRK